MRALIVFAFVLGGATVIGVAMIFAGLYMNRAPLFEAPGFGVRMGLYLRSNVAETGADAVLPELSPLRVNGDPQVALNALAQVATELGWSDVALDEDAGQVRATVVTPLLKFRDDVLVSIPHSGSNELTLATEIRIRSSSRVGRGDLGANRHHIMQLRDGLRRRGLLHAGEL